MRSPGGQVTHYNQSADGRVAYISVKDGTDADTEGGFTDHPAVTVDSSSANITAVVNGTSGHDIEASNVSDLRDLPYGGMLGSEEYYSNSTWDPATGTYTGATTFVRRIADVDNDGTQDDTFLTYSDNHLGGGVTEFSRGYHGTRSPDNVIAGLKGRSNHQATYTGDGEVSGAVGSDHYSLRGDLEMTVTFSGSGAGIVGDISQLTGHNQNLLDQVTFEGEMLGDDPDYAIRNIKLRNGGSDLATMTKESGVGSFFGPNAGGTMGVFAGAGRTVGSSPTDANVLGSFHGSTTDNN